MLRVPPLFRFARLLPHQTVLRALLPMGLSVVLSVAFTTVPVFGARPNYVHIALENFNPEVSPAWAYTLTTEREGKQLVERFNPAKSPTEQWSLLRTEGHAPSSEETEKYFKYKASQAPGAMQATFHKNDIEPGTIQLIHEDSTHAEYACAFREQSANGDKMLGHLQLLLSINKQSAYVESYRLTLQSPYSPVLSVKMNELVVTMNFSAPEKAQPSLPARSSSHFKGRIFLVPFEENISYQYSDFAPAS